MGESSDRIIELERRILRALCDGESSGDVWREAQCALADYKWREPDHSVVYQAVANLRAREPRNWRAQLPAQATRMGFPDLNWEAYLQQQDESTEQIRDLLIELKALGGRGA